jgi:hypothetical protein
MLLKSLLEALIIGSHSRLRPSHCCTLLDYKTNTRKFISPIWFLLIIKHQNPNLNWPRSIFLTMSTLLLGNSSDFSSLGPELQPRPYICFLF